MRAAMARRSGDAACTLPAARISDNRKQWPGGQSSNDDADRANWHPVLVGLIQRRRMFYAVKLWASLRRASAGGALDLAQATADIEAICSLNRPVPDGREYPDLDEAELACYLDVWREVERR